MWCDKCFYRRVQWNVIEAQKIGIYSGPESSGADEV